MTCRFTVVFRERFVEAALLWIDCHNRPTVNGELIVNDVAAGDYLTHTRYIISKRDGSDDGALRKRIRSEQVGG